MPKTQLPAAYTVNGFCAAHGFSRAHLYNLWREGRGPRFMLAGSRRLISHEARDDWVAELESEAAEICKGKVA